VLLEGAALVAVEERIEDGGGEVGPEDAVVVADLVSGDGDVIPVEETAPVVCDNGGSNGHYLGWSGSDLRGHVCGLGVGEVTLPASVGVGEQLGQSVEDELAVKGTHGDAENRLTLIPIVSTPLN
jgi:hypothetical protein